jgi:adenosine deaminase
MSNTTMTKEFKLAQEAFKLTLNDFEKLTLNAMKSAFIPYKKRIKLIYDVIKPGYHKIKTADEKKQYK